MGPKGKRSGGMQPVLIGAAVVALLVGVAALLPKVFPFMRGDRAARIVLPEPPAIMDHLILTVAVLSVIVAVTMRLSVARLDDQRRVRKRPGWQQILTFILIFWASALVASQLAEREDGSRTRPEVAEATPSPGLGDAGEQPRSRALGVVLAGALGVVSLGLFAWIFFLTRPGLGRRLTPDEDLAMRLSEELAAGIDGIRAAASPTEAIIACYARMERLVAAAGVTVRDSDTPHEVVDRALHRLSVPADRITRLTELFERARYSQHTPGEPDRDEAIAALTDVRDALKEHAWVA